MILIDLIILTQMELSDKNYIMHYIESKPPVFSHHELSVTFT